MSGFRITALTALLLLVPALDGQAQEMSTIQPLSFGNLAVRQNTVPQSVRIEPDGSVSYDADIISRIDGQRGEYLFTNLPPNVVFQVGVTVPNPPSEGGLTLTNPSPVSHGGQSFTLSDLRAQDLTTDGNGDGTLYLGATLTTSGTGTMYASGHYQGDFELTLLY